MPAGRCELDRVAQQVVENLLEFPAVGYDEGQVVSQLADEFDFLFVGDGVHQRQEGLAGIAGGDLVEPHGGPACFDLR